MTLAKRWTVQEQVLPEFSRIYDAYHGKVVAYAAKLLGREDAEDVAQEVFVKVSRSIDSLTDPSKLSSWIYAITLNTVRDLARARSAKRECSPALAGPTSLDANEQEPLPDLPDTVSRSAQEVAIRNEMLACFLDYVRDLPPANYKVYVLSEFEGMPNAEIARTLSLSLATVKIRLHRARSRLYESLRQNCRCYHNERGELMGEPKPR